MTKYIPTDWTDEKAQAFEAAANVYRDLGMSDSEVTEAAENLTSFDPFTSFAEELEAFNACLEGTFEQYH